MSFAPGTIVGSYEILEPLGSGGMGEVFLVADTRLGRTAVLKTLQTRHASDEHRMARFEQEARSSSALNHPNIITIYDIGTHEDIPYIAMEYVKGKTLREVLEDGPLPPAQLADILAQIAEGLRKAHKAGIVHRDLKPENIMVSEDGFVKILDFGLAKLTPLADTEQSQLATLSDDMTQAGALVGTVNYMSPEQAKGQPADLRADQFAFGLIAYEMATGRHPFERESAVQTLSAIIEAKHEPIHTHNEAIPDVLVEIFERCLAKDPGGRYDSTADLANDLKIISNRSSTGNLLTTTPTRRRSTSGKLLIGVAAALLVALGLVLWKSRPTTEPEPPAPAAAKIESILVLPLTNLSGDPQQEYFSDGMTEAVITNLARVEALHVISRTSAMHFKNTSLTLPEIAEKLDVEGVVEGAVQRSNGRIQVSASLIDASTDRQIWGETFTRNLEDVFELQNEIARAIAHEIQVALTPEEEQSLSVAERLDPETHELFLQGRFLWYQRTAESLRRAQAYFARAIERDPSFAPAHAGLADTWGFLSCCGYDQVPPLLGMPLAKEAAARALDLDADLADAYTSMAWVDLNFNWDWPAAESGLREAIRLNPGSSLAHMWLSGLLGVRGRHDEALAEAQQSLRVDPLSLIINAQLGLQYYVARRFDAAEAALVSTLEMDPNFPIAHLWLAKSRLAQNRAAEALPALLEYSELVSASAYAQGMLGYGYGRMGDLSRAREIADQMIAAAEDGYVPSHHLALVFVGMGETQEALDWLEKAFTERSDFLIYLGVDPVFDSLRSENRFADLLERVNLQELPLPVSP